MGWGVRSGGTGHRACPSTLGWISTHRYSSPIRRLVVINCPHPKTLVRAVFRSEDFQTIRIPWVPFFEIRWLPDRLLTTAPGRFGLGLSFVPRDGQKGSMAHPATG